MFLPLLESIFSQVFTSVLQWTFLSAGSSFSEEPVQGLRDIGERLAQKVGLGTGIPRAPKHPFGPLEKFYLVPAFKRFSCFGWCFLTELSFITGHLGTQS